MAINSSFDSFLKSIAPELGYEYSLINGPNANFTNVRFQKSSENLILSWDIDNNLLFSGELNWKEIELLRTLFYNKLFPLNGLKIDLGSLKEFISTVYINKFPEDKLLALLEFIQDKVNFDGESINLDVKEFTQIKDQYWRALFFNNLRELDFYMVSAKELGYLKFETAQECYIDVRLTINGLSQVLKLRDEKFSKNCFIAMSFDDEMFRVYNEAIRPAVVETGFEPLMISEKKDIPSDTTINDAILAAIKKSKFTIADFTRHKHGVYFESGYALGQGQKVIYTCRHDEIGKAHFDTRNYPHIVWNDAEDLRTKLIDKIEVFIKG